MLLATAGFSALPGAVTPDYVATPLPANFFNPSAASILFNFAGFDMVTTSATALPDDGHRSLTDATLGSAPTLVAGYNTPTNSAGARGALFSGDFSENLAIDATDLSAWRAGFGTETGAGHTLGDADFDGDVDGGDFLLWQRQLSVTASAAVASSVPEPAPELGLLLLLSGASLYCRGWGLFSTDRLSAL